MKNIIKYLFYFSIFTAVGQKESQTDQIKVTDKLTSVPFGTLQIGGYVGDKLNLYFNKRVMVQDIDRLITPFQIRNDDNCGFRSEFWGKWFTSEKLGYCNHN